MNAFSYIDVILSLSGNRLSNKLFGFRRLGTICNYCVRLLVVSATIFFISWSMAHATKRRVLRVIEEHVSMISGLMVLILWSTRKTRIKALIKCLSCHGADGQEKCLSMWFLVLKIAIMAIDHPQTLVRLAYAYKINLINILTCVFSIVLSTNNYLINYPLAYLFFMRILTSCQVREMRGLRNMISNRGSFRLIAELKRMSAVREEFERLLNFIPFILFAVLFVSIPDAVINIVRHADASTIYSIVALCQVAMSQLSIILVVFIVAYFACKSKEEMDVAAAEVIDALQDRHYKDVETIAYQSLIRALEKYQNFSFTGWTLFSIDRQLILTFLSSVVSFSVLLIQLQSSSL